MAALKVCCRRNELGCRISLMVEMIKKGVTTSITLLLVLALMAPSGATQQTRNPLSLDDIERLLKEGVSSGAIARLIYDRGVNFEVTQSVKDKLRSAGATSEMIVSLERITLEVERKQLEEEPRRRGKSGSDNVGFRCAKDASL